MRFAATLVTPVVELVETDSPVFPVVELVETEFGISTGSITGATGSITGTTGSITGGGGGGGGGWATLTADVEGAGFAAAGLEIADFGAADLDAADLDAADLDPADLAAAGLAGVRLRGAGLAERCDVGGAGGEAGRFVSDASGSWSTEQPYQLVWCLYRSGSRASQVRYESSKVPTHSQASPVQ
ncbi:hypothetical protein GCM10027052_07910 [Parafrigoribacterium mesophilum]